MWSLMLMPNFLLTSDILTQELPKSLSVSSHVGVAPVAEQRGDLLLPFQCPPSRRTPVTLNPSLDHNGGTPSLQPTVL